MSAGQVKALLLPQGKGRHHYCLYSLNICHPDKISHGGRRLLLKVAQEETFKTVDTRSEPVDPKPSAPSDPRLFVEGKHQCCV